jgi:flagellar basal-body rod modification protein FlgD
MPIGSVTNAPATLQSSSLGLNDLLNILLTQLRFQDPLEPVDNKEFIAQVAQFTSLEQTQQLNSKIEQLVVNQSALQSVGLIGRNVVADANGTSITGKVASVSLAGDIPTVSIETGGGAVVPNIALSQINSISAPN